MSGVIFLLSVMSLTTIMCICFNIHNIRSYLKGYSLKILIIISSIISVINLIMGYKHNSTYMLAPCIIITLVNILLWNIVLKGDPLPDLKYKVRRFVINNDKIKIINHSGYVDDEFDNDKKSTNIVYKNKIINITNHKLKKSAKKHIICAKRKERRGEYVEYECLSIYSVKHRSMFDYIKILMFLIGYTETIGIYTWIAFAENGFNINEYWFANNIDMSVCLIVAVCTFIISFIVFFIDNIKSKIGLSMFVIMCYMAQIMLGAAFIKSLII